MIDIITDFVKSLFPGLERQSEQNDCTMRLQYLIAHQDWPEATFTVIQNAIDLVGASATVQDKDRLTFAIGQMIAMRRLDRHFIASLDWLIGVPELAAACGYADAGHFMRECASGSVAAGEVEWLRWAALTSQLRARR